MDAIVISDIHLGAHNCQAKTLCAFLQTVRREIKPKKLILNGDVFDSFDTRLRKRHWEVLTDLRKMSDEMEVVWIQGNHDRDGPADMVSHLFGATFYQKSYCFASGGKQVLCVHGDRWDTFTSKRPILTWAADQVYWFLQWVDPSFYLAKLAKRSSKTFLRNAERVEIGARTMMAEKGCDIVLTGHTHHPVARGDYFNSGSWTEHPPTYLEVDNGRVELKSFFES